MTSRRSIILNGKVADDADVRTALGLLVSDGTSSEVVVTREAGDATKLARAAAGKRADQIVVFGGDGTLAGVATGLTAAADEGEAFEGVLGIVPTGTANDFATAAGLAVGDPAEAAAALPGLTPVALDVGHGGPGAFLNVVTAGFGSEVSSEVSKELKAVLGRVAYLVAAVSRVGDVEPRVARIRARDFDRTTAFYLLAIGNGRCAGGGVPVCPDAVAVDGLFDITIVPEGSLPGTLAEIVKQGLSGLGDAGIRLRSPWIELESDNPLQVNLDGEALEAREFRFEVRPGALRVLLPPDSPLLRGPERRA